MRTLFSRDTTRDFQFAKAGLENIALSTRIVSTQGCTNIGKQAFEFAMGGDVISKEQCQKAQSFIMNLETADKLTGLFELTTAR